MAICINPKLNELKGSIVPYLDCPGPPFQVALADPSFKSLMNRHVLLSGPPRWKPQLGQSQHFYLFDLLISQLLKLLLVILGYVGITRKHYLACHVLESLAWSLFLGFLKHNKKADSGPLAT